MNSKTYLLHALSPLHAGVGQAADVIDLPIARMHSTGIPIVPGSSIKGVLRDARCSSANSDQETIFAVFGPETKGSSEHAGALIVSDARLLCLPVRSFKGTFAWVTSPLLLNLARRDFGKDAPDAFPEITGRSARVADPNASALHYSGKVYLEDIDLELTAEPATAAWSQLLARHIAPDGNMFARRFVVVDDETMTFLFETATQVDTRVRLESKTRTVAKGALWTEESLPPETVLVGVLAADKSRRKNKDMTPEEVLRFAAGETETLQFGGKATVGRGICRLIPVSGGKS